MTSVRQPAVAGLFYPEDAATLYGTIATYLDAAEPAEAPPKAVIVPHAGYLYSGPIAAKAYARLAAGRAWIRRIVLLGPSHRVGFPGLALPSADRFRTPLGEVPVDTAARELLQSLPQVHVLDEPHLLEHSLEVQIPFLQVVLDQFTLLPLAAGRAAPEKVAEVLDLVWGGPETVFVISSDLSHYHDYQTCRDLDAATVAAIERLDERAVGPEDACGAVPVGGLLLAARRHDLQARAIDVQNSGDTAGDRTRVVGYGAFVFY